MVALRAHMQERFADWQADLPEQSGWPAFFNDCEEPIFDLIPEAAEIAEGAATWPGRRNFPLPRAPTGAHICRAFEGLEPDDVCVVVLGQDPYPAIESATGRAFEDGTPDAAGLAIRPALRTLGQSALDLHGAACPLGFCHGLVGRSETIRARFNAIAQQGVLCLNASWTYSDGAHQSAHRGVWRPTTAFVLRRLAERDTGAPVILLLGTEAQDFFDELRLDTIPNAAVVRKCHPTERHNRYFAGLNPFQSVNEALAHLGKDPITWWPIAEQEA
jgi:uracil-DNA glycosylase